jgi:hypothetical protein
LHVPPFGGKNSPFGGNPDLGADIIIPPSGGNISPKWGDNPSQMLTFATAQQSQKKKSQVKDFFFELLEHDNIQHKDTDIQESRTKIRPFPVLNL